MMTPYDKLKSLPKAHDYLKPGGSFAILDTRAYQISDNQAAARLPKARQTLFKTIHERILKTG
ncbi:MAG: hypothetical protein A2V62_13290 [Nitrospirae bacterium RBG_19FT_COMBO_58_9]|nr:MAG: hypothetical protein A2V62_13290 [Nitrospirae bacterium RBG_19FT_COMBO_58_9]